MKTIVIASQNPVKVRAVENGFRSLFPTEPYQSLPVSIPSGVSDQPMSDAETLRGAQNRLLAAQQRHPQADFWMGIEGGVEDSPAGLVAFAWIVAASDGRFSQSRTATFLLPPPVAELVRQGMELGLADDQVFGRSNSKQDNGAVGLLTGNVIDRARYYEQAVILALIPFKNPHLYP